MKINEINELEMKYGSCYMRNGYVGLFCLSIYLSSSLSPFIIIINWIELEAHTFRLAQRKPNRLEGVFEMYFACKIAINLNFDDSDDLDSGVWTHFQEHRRKKTAIQILAWTNFNIYEFYELVETNFMWNKKFH